jgi:hypothetical protein
MAYISPRDPVKQGDCAVNDLLKLVELQVVWNFWMDQNQRQSWQGQE